MRKSYLNILCSVLACTFMMADTVLARREISVGGGAYIPSESTLGTAPLFYGSYSFPICGSIMVQIYGAAAKFKPSSDYKRYDSDGTRFKSTYQYHGGVLAHYILPIAAREDIYLNLGVVGVATSLEYLKGGVEKSADEFAIGLLIDSGLRVWLTDAFALSLGGDYRYVLSDADRKGLVLRMGLVFR